MERYIRNEKMLSRDENLKLRSYRVVVAGCGGLGGYAIEMLARMGIGQITAIDGDVFEASNLNRQLLSNPGNMGMSKSEAAKDRVSAINPEVTVHAVHAMITAGNADSLLQGHDVIVDALDSIESRRVLVGAARNLGIPMVFGAIAGWYAQISTIFPGDDTLDIIYPEGTGQGAETQLGNPAFTPALAASLQVAETLKVLLKKEGVLRNKMLVIDTLNHEYQVVGFNVNV